jgi:hypothetical protein
MAVKSNGKQGGTATNEAVTPLDWREILNEEACWRGYSDFRVWFKRVAPNLDVPGNADYDMLCGDLDFIRTQASQIYFGRKPDAMAINERLKNVVLGLDLDATDGTRLPSLLARASSNGAILERLFGALLVGFAQFVADYQKGGDGLCRCEGVFRDSQMTGRQLDESEKRYRQEISLLAEQQLLEDPSIQRCADFFVGRSKARFCSDACRFMTFQISKQLKDPKYLAEKQRRYRSKLKDSLE